MPPSETRREALRLGGSALLVAFAGCAGRENGSGTTRRTTPPTTRTSTTESETRASTTDEPTTHEPTTDEPTQTPENPAELAWTYSTDYDVQYPVAVAGERIYVPSDALYALSMDGERRWTSRAGPIESSPRVSDAVYVLLSADIDAGAAVSAVEFDGTERWQYRPGHRVDLLTVGEKRVYATRYTHVGSASNEPLIAIDSTSGEERWRSEIGAPSEAMVADGTIYVSSPGVVRAFDTADGTKQWEQTIEGKSYEPIAGLHENTLVARGDGTYALSRETGRVQWQRDGEEALLAEGSLYATVGDNNSWRVVAVDPATGRERWRTREFTDDRRPALVHDDVLYAASGIDAGVSAIDVADGTVRWSWSELQNTWNLAYSDGTLLVTHGNRLAAIDATGTTAWRFQATADFSGLVTAAGRAYLGTRAGKLFAFEV